MTFTNVTRRPVVRYFPDRLVFNTAEGFRDVYGHGKNTYKLKANIPHSSGSRVNIHDCVNKEVHGRKRRIISQSFAAAALTSYEPIILNHVRSLSEAVLSTAATDWPLVKEDSWLSPQDITSWMNYLTLDVISDLVYGQSFNLVTERDLRWLIDTIVASNCRNRLKISFPKAFGAKTNQRLGVDNLIFSTLANEWQRLLGALDKLTEKGTDSRHKIDDRNDILSALALAHDPKTGDKLTEAEVRDEARLLVTAGSDTTATALSTIFFHLSHHTDIYSRLTEEILTTFPTVEHIRQGPLLASCHYLRACIDESMRLSPSLPGPSWRAIGPAGATIGGEHIPAGYEVAVDLYALHHNPTYFPNPFVYNPDRFIPPKVVIPDREPTLTKPKFDFFPTSRANTIFPSSPAALSPNSFQGMYFPQVSQEGRENKAFAPFMIGPGSCVGKPLAYLEMSLTVARMVWALDFRAVDGGGEGKGESLMGDWCGGSRKGPLLQFRSREDGDVRS